MGLFKILIYSAFSLCERYIVMFNMSSNGTGPTALEDSVQTYSSRLANAMSYMDGEDKIVTKTRMGFIADMKDSTAVKMNNCPDIAVVEKDGPVHIAFNKGTDVKTPPNYTDGIKEVNIPFSSLYGDKYKKIQKHDSAYFRKGSGKMKTRKIISHESEDYDNSESTTSSDISNSSTDSGSYYKHDFEGQNNKYSIPFCDEEVYLKNKNSKPIKKEFPQGDEKEFPQGDEKEFPQGDEKEFLRGGEKEFLEGDKKDLPKVKPVVNNIKNKTEDNFKIKYKVRKIFRKLKSGGLEKNKSPKNPKSPKKRKMSPWGLKRISQIENWNNQSFVFPIRAGRNVEVFVIDTGIDAEHPEFGGRARLGANFIENSPNTDENGHGTHVAGIIGSECCGVAKEAKIVGVKVLDQHGAGKISKVIQGIDYVIGEHSKKFEEDAYDA
ncbi:putative subtilisin-like proteinase 1, partial [Dictyocoela roeselum]